MVTYTVFLKELSASSAWQDITHAVVQSKDIPIRKGFGSLSDGIDVGSLTLTIHMESLQDAALLHVSQKQVLVQADGVTIFEGVSYDDADIDVEERSDYVFAKLKFKPYSALFKQAKVPADTVWMDKKICDPEDTDNSLVHLLFDMIIENLPGQLPDILSALFNVSTAITNTKTLALVMLEAGESVEEYLTELLYQNGYAYWMELYTAIVVAPYATGRTPSANLPITDIVAKPEISQAPYIDEKKCVVRLGKIEEYADEVVYELNGDRYEDSGEPTQVALLEPGDYYPTDSDDEPSELEADYETERENDDVELVYAEGLSYDYMVRQNNPEIIALEAESAAAIASGDFVRAAEIGIEIGNLLASPNATLPAYIVFGTHELTPTQATFQLYNNLAVNVSLRNIRVLAQTAYYRNWSEKYYDESTTATEEDEIDGIWMPDSATARAFVKRYRAELKAQATHVSFQTHVALQPNTLFTITGLPYQLLVRYVTKLEEDFYEYECVAYSVDTISVGTRIRVAPKKTAMNGFSPVPVHLYALGDETAPFDTSTVVSDGTSVVSDGINRLGVSSDWTLERPTPTAGQYVWQIIGYYTPPATWPTVWSEPVRLTGDKGEQGIQGLQGLQGPEGAQGIQGPTGADGLAAYSHIAYADDAIGTGFSQDPTGKEYIGFYADHTEDDSTDPADYAWSLIKGADGAQGIPGPTGDDGLTAYFHTAWANSADGETDFSTTVSAGKTYIGTYSDHTQDDSTDPDDYAWVLIKGADGVDYTGIEILVSPQQVYYSDRGTLRTQGIQLSAILHNLTGTALFSLDGHGVLEDILDVNGDPIPNVKYLNLAGNPEANPPVAPVPYDDSVITVTINLGGYSKSFTIVKVREGIPTPLYLGSLTNVPDSTYMTDDGPLIIGDHFLYNGSYVGSNPEHDPNNPDNTEAEMLAARDLSAPISESGEYIPGRMYAWNGTAWGESRNSAHLSNAFYDALRLAELSGSWLYAAVVVAQLGLFMELLVTKLSSPNVTRDATGKLTDGFVIDGINRLIETYNLKSWNAEIYGFLESKGFRTLIGGDIQNVSTYNVPKSIYNFHLSVLSRFPAGGSILGYPVAGSFEGFSFTRGVQQPGANLLLASHDYEYEDMSPGETHDFSALYPSKHFGSTFTCKASGSYAGIGSHRYHGRQGNPTESSLPESYTDTFTKTLGASEEYFNIRHVSTRWFGTKSSYALHSVYTSRSFYDYTLLLLNVAPSWSNPKDTRTAILGSKLISYGYNAYLLSASHPFTIGAYNQDSATVKKYASGTDFYNRFSAIPVGANGFATGKIKYSAYNGPDTPTEYTVTRLAKTETAIVLTVGGGIVITINKFTDGGTAGVYKHIEISEQIQYRPTVSGMEVQHIMPWGFNGTYPTDGIFPYAVGGKDASDRPLRFTEGWFGSLDVLYDVALRNLKVNGILQALGSANDIGQTTAKFRNLYLSGAVNAATLALSGAASVGGALSAATVNTGQGATEVYKETFESISLDSTYPVAGARTATLVTMAVGETKRVYVWNKERSGYTNTVYLPSGGSYSVSDAVMAGGAACWSRNGEETNRVMEYAFIVWRIS